MLKSRLRASFLLLSICAFLGVCVTLTRRNHRVAERLRLDREYLAWDFHDTPEEIACQSATADISPRPIPRLVHFILIAEQGEQAELEFYQYLAIKAAILRIQPESVRIHTYALNEENVWWRQIRQWHQVPMNVVIHQPRTKLQTSDGRSHKLRLPHQTDVLRLEILHREGGIYLDTDVYALQSFSALLQSPRDLLMGHEGGNRSGIGNAVMVSRPESAFIARWLAAYKRSFDNRPEMWNHHSVKVPAELAKQYPEEICKLSPSAFFWPTWSSEHVDSMHQPISGDELGALQSNISQYNGAMYPNQLAYHAWGNIARQRFLSQLNPDGLLGVQSSFNILLREIYQTKL